MTENRPHTKKDIKICTVSEKVPRHFMMLTAGINEDDEKPVVKK